MATSNIHVATFIEVLHKRKMRTITVDEPSYYLTLAVLFYRTIRQCKLGHDIDIPDIPLFYPEIK